VLVRELGQKTVGRAALDPWKQEGAAAGTTVLSVFPALAQWGRRIVQLRETIMRAVRTSAMKMANRLLARNCAEPVPVCCGSRFQSSNFDFST
jgi:hypothetical protein